MIHIRLLLLSVSLICLQAAERWVPFGPQTMEPISLHGGIVAVARGAGGSIVLRADGSIDSWGIGSEQLATPPPDVVKIASSGGQCATITREGDVRMLIGMQPVPSITTATQIAPGYFNNVALLSDGSVVSWRTSDGFASPVAGVSQAVSVTSGSSGVYAGVYDYAVRSDGTVLRWDAVRNVSQMSGLSNVRKMLAAGEIALHVDGTITSFNSFVPSGLSDVKDAVQALDCTFLLKTTGELQVYGQASSFVGWLPEDIGPVAEIAGAGGALIALRMDGTVVAWTLSSTWGGGNTVPASIPEASTLVLGSGYHQGTVSQDGTLRLWGPREYGESEVPVGLGPVLDARTGIGFTVALRTDGTVHAWGDNRLGQTAVPAGASPATAIATGYAFTLALKPNGTVVGWGSGLGSVVPAGLADVISISVGFDHAVALRSDGTVVAWGRNVEGQCNVPSGLDNVASIASGELFSAARRMDGSILMWGTDVPTAGTPPNSSDYTAIAAHKGGVIALRPGGIDVCYNRHIYSHMVAPASGLGPASAVSTMGDGFYARAEPVSCPIALTDETVLYDGRAHCLHAVPSVPGVICNWRYDGAFDFPSAVGTYTAVASVDTWAYTGSATAILRIVHVLRPTVSVIAITNDTTPTWTWTANGGGVGAFRYALDDPALLSPTITTDLACTPTALAPGNHTLYVQERDGDGHWSDAGSATVVIDTTPPTVSLTASVTSALQGERFEVEVGFSETVSGYVPGMIICSGATLHSVTAVGDGRTFRAELTAGPPGPMTMSVGAGSTHDVAGNPNLASPELVVTALAGPASQPSEGIPGEYGGSCGSGAIGLLVFHMCCLLLWRRRELLR